MNARWERWNDPRVQLLGFALAHVVIFACVFRALYIMPYSGTGLYYDYGSALLAGKVPYRDYLVEYPPLALAFFTLPRLVGASFRWYYVAYQYQVVIFDLIALATLYAARDRSEQPWRVLGAYTVAILAVGPIVFQQFDIFPAVFTLLAVYCYSRERDTGAWIFLALGVMTKVYPALIAPVFLILDWQRGRRVVHLARMAGAFTATCLLVALPLLVIAPTSLVRLYAYHAHRGIQLESVFSSIALAIWRFTTTPMRCVLNFGSWNLAGPVPDRLAAISGPVLALLLLLAYAFIFVRTKSLDDGAIRRVRLVATCSALVLFVGLVGSKVFSPQYLIWLVTLVPLAVAPRRMTVLTLFALVGVATYYIYPRHYADLRAFLDSGVAALDVRNTLLVTLTVIVANALRLATLPAAAGSPEPQPEVRSTVPA